MGRRRFAARLACVGAALAVAAGVLAVAGAPAARASAVVLTVRGPKGARSYTLAQLKSSFTAYAGYAGYVKTGRVGMQSPRPVRGVRLLDLLKKVGYRSGSVTLTASDGYRYAYSSRWVHGQGVTMYKASPPGYPAVRMPAADPLTAILAYQEKKAGARTGDSHPWLGYAGASATSGSDGIGPLRFWWAYRVWSSPGYVQIGWTSMRMVRTVRAD